MMFQQANITQQNATITSTLQQIQSLQNKLILAKSISTLAGGANASSMSTVSTIQDALAGTLTTLANQTSQVQASLQTNLPITVAGNDVAQQPATASFGQTASNTTRGRDLSRETNLLGRRLSWAVRANQDKNYLMIDDAFEKDPDILYMGVKFNSQSQIPLFRNQYTTVREQIQATLTPLNLEAFADTQGHIRIRPQQYNKMPSSVFNRMMQMRQNNSVQIYPSFLETLFVQQIGSLLNRLAVIELEIRLDGAVLGIVDDPTLSTYLSSTGGGGPFTFISDRNGNITNLANIQTNANPDLVLQSLPTAFTASIAAQGALTSVFNAADRAKLVISTVIGTPGTTVSTSITSTEVQRLAQLIFQKSGTAVVLNNFLQPNQDGAITQASTSQVDAVSVTNTMADWVLQRQHILTQTAGAINNARESATLTSSPTDLSNGAQVPNLYNNSNVPQVFQNMLEDENFDDLGPGSGTRYVIHDWQIIDLRIGEKAPDYNMIEIQGILSPFSPDSPQELQGFSAGGSVLTTAAAVDYDMWRQYGLRGGTNMHIQAPFFTDPENQCAPFAAMMLSRARKNIIQGSLIIAGNEYMQPGEVIFIESRGLLFYVEAVQHHFSFGAKFTTTLTLTYGHNPGEFIPTPLDIVGKLIYNNRDTASSIAYRNTTTNNEIPVGAIILNPQSTSSLSPTDSVLSGTYGAFNLQALNQILYTTTGVFNSNQTSNSNLTPTVELRVFYNSKNGQPPSSITSAKSVVQSLLTGGSIAPQAPLVSTPISIQLPSASVIADSTTNVDSSSGTEYRSPSQKAVDAARNVASSFPGAGGMPADPIGSAMSQFIIDAVIVFNNSTTSNTGTTTPAGLGAPTLPTPPISTPAVI